MSRIAEKFAAARSEGRAAFIPYLTAGDPNLPSTAVFARALTRAGADILELGVPFSDPIADGPTLQRAAQRALASGTTLARVLESASEIRRTTPLALVLFSYLNPLLAYGIERLADDARKAGVDGLLVTDLPPEEGDEIHRRFADAGLDTIFLASPTSPAVRMRRAVALSSGFLYVVSRAGITGERDRLAQDLAATVERARREAGRKSLPIAVGFGIASAEAAAAAASLADGVVVGSALVAELERASAGAEEAIERLAAKLAGACRLGAQAKLSRGG